MRVDTHIVIAQRDRLHMDRHVVVSPSSAARDVEECVAALILIEKRRNAGAAGADQAVDSTIAIKIAQREQVAPESETAKCS